MIKMGREPSPPLSVFIILFSSSHLYHSLFLFPSLSHKKRDENGKRGGEKKGMTRAGKDDKELARAAHDRTVK